MSLNVTAKSFTGKYGDEGDEGDIIHVQIEMNNDDIFFTGKEVIFLIDISGSMESSMKKVKSSLLAIRDSIVGKSSLEMMKLEPDERDNLFRNTINVRLITFSNDATEVWSRESDSTFENAVINLHTEAMTNMSDGLKMAFEKVHPDLFTWIIVMTDGESNMGPCRTANSFQKFVTRTKPLNSKIVTLGYGNKFDPEVLDVVGNFVYLENAEMIPVVLGNLAEEIMTSIGFNCTIDTPTITTINNPNTNNPNPTELTELTDDTIIDAGDNNQIYQGKILVGNRVVGSLCNNRIYNYIYRPHGHKCNNDMIRKYNKVTICYTNIRNGDRIEKEYDIYHTDEVPSDKIRDLYFNSKKKHLMYRIYKVINTYGDNKKYIKKELEMIKKAIESWEDDSIADPHADEIYKLIEDVHKEHKNNVHKASTALNIATGTGYTRCENSDSDEIGISRFLGSTLMGTQYYLASPLLNDNIDTTE